jgi:hypothetical protein
MTYTLSTMSNHIAEAGLDNTDEEHFAPQCPFTTSTNQTSPKQNLKISQKHNWIAEKPTLTPTVFAVTSRNAKPAKNTLFG